MGETRVDLLNLLEPRFEPLLAEHGRRPVTFTVNGQALAVASQRAAWGDLRDRPPEQAPRNVGLRELERVLASLAESFPMLGSLVDRRLGGQTRLPIAPGDTPVDVLGGHPSAADPADAATSRDRGDGGDGSSGAAPAGDQAEPAAPPPDTAAPEGRHSTPRPWSIGPHGRRAARFNLRIAFAHRADDREIARLVESTVTVNTAHSAYARAQATRALGYHVALSVALALAPVAVEPADHHAFITSCLARWGDAIGATPARRGRPRSTAR